MKIPYGAIEPDTKFKNVINALNAKQVIDLYKLEKYTDTVNANSVEYSINVDYVYQLYEGHDELMDYVVDYMRFDYDRICIVIKPNKWMK